MLLINLKHNHPINIILININDTINTFTTLYKNHRNITNTHTPIIIYVIIYNLIIIYIKMWRKFSKFFLEQKRFFTSQNTKSLQK